MARARPAITEFFALLGDFGHGLEVTVGGNRKACLDDVDAHLVEDLGDLQLLSSVMEAPGDCSPSRKVVSKMKTWSLSVAVILSFLPFDRRPESTVFQQARARSDFNDLVMRFFPLSARP
jgi:hypothetical protein